MPLGNDLPQPAAGKCDPKASTLRRIELEPELSLLILMDGSRAVEGLGAVASRDLPLAKRDAELAVAEELAERVRPQRIAGGCLSDLYGWHSTSGRTYTYSFRTVP